MSVLLSNNGIKRFLKDDKANSAVEFAIVAPVFLLMVFGLIAYGIYFGASHSVQQLAADAARTAVAGLDEDEREALADAYLAANAASYPLLDGRKLKIRVGTSQADANQFLVSLEYDAGELPIWGLLKDLPLPGKTIERSASIRVGGI